MHQSSRGGQALDVLPVDDVARAQLGSLRVAVTELPHHAHSMLASERTMSQACRRVGKVDDGAVAQILPEARTIHLYHHPVGGSLRMLLEKSASIAVGPYTGDARSGQELFPEVGRARPKYFSDFIREFSVVLRAGACACEPCIREQVRPVRRNAESPPFAIETAEENPAQTGLVETIKRIEPVALLVGQRARGAAVVIISLVGVGPGVRLHHRDFYRLSAARASARQQGQQDTGCDRL